MDLKSFSAGYWMTNLDLIPYGGERAVMDVDDHYRLSKEVYGCECQHPILMRYGDSGGHVEVYPSRSVPRWTVAIPTDGDFARQERQVMIAKRTVAENLLLKP